MIVTFSTDAYGEITMFGDVAVQLLKMMGHSGTVPGAILAAEAPVALSKLKEALNNEQAQTSATEDDSDKPQVSMASRAVTLIDLLTAAATKKTDVMWE